MVTRVNEAKKSKIITKDDLMIYNEGFLEGYKRALIEIRTYTKANMSKYIEKSNQNGVNK